MKQSTAFLACVVVMSPALASADPFRPSMADQVKLGADEAARIRKEEPILKATDPRVIELRKIGAELVAAIPPNSMRGKPWSYTFDIIDKKEVNAFALPGGPIFFYSGILDKMTTKDQIAGVVGHEIVHVLNQHWASQYADNTKRRLGILAVLTILNAGDTVFDLASVGDALYSLGYSRKHETESDKVGFDIMMRAGYNPNGMAEIFEMLAKEGSGGGPEWARTHPDANKRVASIREMIKKETRPLPPVRARDAKSIAAGTTASPGERLPGKGGGTTLGPAGTRGLLHPGLGCGC